WQPELTGSPYHKLQPTCSTGRCHSANLVGRKIVLYAGASLEEYAEQTEDVVTLDVDSWEFRKVELRAVKKNYVAPAEMGGGNVGHLMRSFGQQTTPFPRFTHTAVRHVAGNRILVAAGWNNNCGTLGDLWELNIADYEGPGDLQDQSVTLSTEEVQELELRNQRLMSRQAGLQHFLSGFAGFYGRAGGSAPAADELLVQLQDIYYQDKDEDEDSSEEEEEEDDDDDEDDYYCDLRDVDREYSEEEEEEEEEEEDDDDEGGNSEDEDGSKKEKSSDADDAPIAEPDDMQAMVTDATGSSRIVDEHVERPANMSELTPHSKSDASEVRQNEEGSEPDEKSEAKYRRTGS
ncbi:hypothetical protein CYMTET_12288, partial [Cymbomonas tetramitiformis]